MRRTEQSPANHTITNEAGEVRKLIILYILAAVIIAFLLYALFLFVCGLFVDPKKEYTDDSRFYRCLLNGATSLAMKLLRIRIHVTGMEKVPENTRLLFVGNHRSNFDPIITWHVFKRWNIAFVSKEGNFSIPIFGRIIRKCCFMAIDRENPRKALPTINNAAELLRRQEVSVGVYPEGTRSKNGRLLPFHNAVFKIAQKAESPIVVLSIAGTERIHKQYPFHSSHIYLDVLEVIPPESIKGVKTEMIGTSIRSLLETQSEMR